MVVMNMRDFARDALGSGIGFWLCGSIPIEAGFMAGGIYASVKQVVPKNLSALVSKLDPIRNYEESWTDEWVILKVSKVAFTVLGTLSLQAAAFSKVLNYSHRIIGFTYFFGGVGFNEILIGPIVNAALGALLEA